MTGIITRLLHWLRYRSEEMVNTREGLQVIEHHAYLTDRPYQRRIHRHAQPDAGFSTLTILHDRLGRCCRREPWETTYRRLSLQLDFITGQYRRVC
jgi:hypothetical protein